MAVQISTNGSATSAEAAAIAAALEQFRAETAPAAPPADEVSRWQRAALLEGVDKAPRADVWGSQPARRI
jgi:hypothetical protein